MNSEPPITSLNDLLRQIINLVFSAIATNWRSILSRLSRFMRRRLRPRRQRGLYQILNYDTTLDLTDAGGKTATMSRRQKVRFLQDHVIAYQDEAWGDGDLLVGYSCHPGVPVDQFQVGSRQMILISLRETKNRGDVVEFNIKRLIKNGFTKAEEWLEVETRYPTRHLRVNIIFPKRRPCQQIRLTEKRKEKTTLLSQRHWRQTADGRKMLIWEKRHPAQFESYTFTWTW